MQRISCGFFVVVIALMIPAGAQGGFIYVSGTGASPGYYQSLETGNTFTDAITTQYDPQIENYMASDKVTLVTGAVDTLLFNVPQNYLGLPANCLLYVSGTQVGALTVSTPFLNTYAELHRLGSTYDFQIVNGSANLTAVPEPCACVLAVLGGGALVLTRVRWRRTLTSKSVSRASCRNERRRVPC